MNWHKHFYPNEESQETLELLPKLQWNLWREKYNNLTFEQRQKMYDDFLPNVQVQVFYKANFFINCLKQIPDLENKVIAEFGSYRAELAVDICKALKIKKYRAYEISKWAVENTNAEAKNYPIESIALTKEFWLEDMDDFDIFTSSDSLEHITAVEMFQLMDFLVKKNCKYLILQLDMLPNRITTWDGLQGTHINELTLYDMGQLFIYKGYKFREIYDGNCVFFQRD